MSRIAIVGAGSLVFTRTLVSDLLQQEATADCEVHLVDIDKGRLKDACRAVEHLAARAGRKVHVVASTSCAEGARGCDYVIVTVQVGGRKATRLDFEIPERFGVRQTIADTHGIGGISRAMRTLPAVLEIAKTVADVAPDAWLLNYTNPMAMVVMGLAQAGLGSKSVGLCHGTENTASTIARYLGLSEPSRLCWTAAGINHMTWFLKLLVDGKDVYPALREFAERVEILGHEDSVRLELLRRFGYYVSESSVHNAEYYPWFLRDGGETEKYGVRVREYLYRLDDLKQEFETDRAGGAENAERAPLELQTNEYAPRVIAALEANSTIGFMGNIVNREGVIANLPANACVEVPCFVHRAQLVSGSVGPLPEQCAALNGAQVNVQLLTVAGVLEGCLDKIYQAAFLDPLLSAQLKLDDIKSLVDEMVAAHGNPCGLH